MHMATTMLSSDDPAAAAAAAAGSGHIVGSGSSSSPQPSPSSGDPDIDALRSKWSSYSCCTAVGNSTRGKQCFQIGGKTSNSHQQLAKEHPYATAATVPPAAPGATVTGATTDTAKDTCGERGGTYCCTVRLVPAIKKNVSKKLRVDLHRKIRNSM